MYKQVAVSVFLRVMHTWKYNENDSKKINTYNGANQGVFHDILESTQLTVVSAVHRIFCSLRQLHQDKVIKEVKKVVQIKCNNKYC